MELKMDFKTRDIKVDSDLSVQDTYQFGNENIKKLFNSIQYDDKSIKRLIQTDVRLSQAIATNTVLTEDLKFNFDNIDTSGRFVDYNSYIYLTVQAQTVADAIIAMKHKINFTRKFNLFKTCEMWMNSISIQKVENIGLIRDMWSLLTMDRNELNNEHFLSHDDANGLSNSCIELGNDITQINMETITESADTKFNNIGLVFTVTADTQNVTVTTDAKVDAAEDRTITIELKDGTTQFDRYERRYYKNLPAGKRKYELLDKNGTSAPIITFKIPLWYFFPWCDSLGKHKYFPSEKLSFSFTCGNPKRYLVGEGVAGDYGKLIFKDCRLILNTVEFSAPVQKSFFDLAKKEKLVLPFIHYTTRERNLADGQRDPSYDTNHENIIYVINVFRNQDADNIDPFQYRLPKAYNRGNDEQKNSVVIRKKFQYETHDLYRSSDQELVFDGPNGNWVKLYEDYRRAAVAVYNNHKELPISYDEIGTYRPIFITLFPEKPQGVQTHNKKSMIKRIDEIYNFSQDNTANTAMISVYAKMAYLLYDGISNKLETINST
jgi:hypothetical protein